MKTVLVRFRITLLFAILVLCQSLPIIAQTSLDSLKIIGSPWQETALQEGIIHKHMHHSDLFGGPQNINFVAIAKGHGYRLYALTSDTLVITSKMARANNALVAVNGTYYNVKKRKTNCYFRIDKNIIAKSEGAEDFRLSGAIYMKKKKVKIIPWSKKIESNYHKSAGITVASGPLLISKGKISSFPQLTDDNFYKVKHPRTAIGITKNKQLIMLTIDGRLPGHAIGVSIPEIAYLMKQLGCEYALNLDGGGSSTLWSSMEKNNGVLNTPCTNGKADQFGERPNASIIFIGK